MAAYIDISALIFDTPDAPSNIVQDTAKESIKAASFAKLIEKTTGPTGGSCTSISFPSWPSPSPNLVFI
jgi:hypothetical protein